MQSTNRRLRAARRRLAMATYRHNDRDMVQAALTTLVLRLASDASRRSARRYLTSVRPGPEGNLR
ncbi:hypothetical protein [Nocardiopsis synnemataformans]|uniref:hypothetical protein n=1 Tax=Nocardiopsis synnemataformans TaxID=61305 RepID=UPI003EC10C1F